VIHSIGPKTHILERFGPFHYCTKVHAKLAELVPLLHKFAKKVALEFFATNAPDPLRSTQNLCDGAFWTVSLLHESRCKLAELVPLTQSSLNKVASKFLATDAPDPFHWTQNSCFGPFRTILILHESRCKTSQTGAIIAQVR
jgi:hypothetical protein